VQYRVWDLKGAPVGAAANPAELRWLLEALALTRTLWNGCRDCSLV
jgi:hypothetical protein